MQEVINVSGCQPEIIKEEAGKEKAFVYLDPPYYPVTKNVNALYNCNFKPVDFLKLKLRCDEFTMNGVAFLLHNSDCEFIRILFKDYPMVEVQEPRGVKGKKSKEKCLIITNFEKREDFMDAIQGMNKLMGVEDGNV